MYKPIWPYRSFSACRCDLRSNNIKQRMYRFHDLVKARVLCTLFLPLGVLLLLVSTGWSQSNILSVQLKGSGAGYKEVRFSDGSKQTITWNAEVLFDLAAQPTRRDDVLVYTLPHLEGSIRFWGTAVDDHPIFGQSWDFDRIKNVTVDGGSGELHYSLSKLQIVFIDFLLPPSITLAPDPYRVSFLGQKNKTIGILRFQVDLPNDWYFDNDYDIPGTAVTDEIVTINVTTFIPANYIKPPLGPDCGTAPLSVGVFHKGDDRIKKNGKPKFSPKATTFRTRQVVTIFRDGSAVNPGVVGPAVLAALPETGPTEEYAWNALLVDGRISPQDRDPTLNDCSLLHRKGKATTRKMKVDTDINGDIVVVRLHGGAKDPLVRLAVLEAAHIDWDFTFIIDFSGASPVYAFRGEHDGFPAYEVYINNQKVWTYDPGPRLCFSRAFTVEAGEEVDLIEPMPDYCIEQVFKLFPPLDVYAKPKGGLVPPR
jgi:hypothetical protein